MCSLGKRLATGAACASYGPMPARVGSQCLLHVNKARGWRVNQSRSPQQVSEDTVAVANLCSQQSFHLVFAAALNARGVATARGGRWQAQTVSNVRARSA